LLPGSNGWEARSDTRAPNNVVLVDYAGRPAGLSAQLRCGTLRLRFLKHGWSGWVRVNANHETRTIDLYSPATREENLYFQPPVTGDDALAPPKEYRLDVPKSRSDYGYIHFRPAPYGQIRLVSAVVDGRPANIRDGRTIVLPESVFAPARCALMAAILTAILLASLLIAASDLCRRHPRLPIWILPVAASLTMSLLWAAICYPANLSNDSLDLLHQATTGNYHDWHPIGMTLRKRAIYSAMASFPLHVIVATSAVIIGFVFWLAISATLYGVITPKLARLAGLVATFAYYPLWMYGPTLQKDVWFAISFIPLFLQAYKRVVALTHDPMGATGRNPRQWPLAGDSERRQFGPPPQQSTEPPSRLRPTGLLRPAFRCSANLTPMGFRRVSPLGPACGSAPSARGFVFGALTRRPVACSGDGPFFRGG
jgi:hypothetical protein